MYPAYPTPAELQAFLLKNKLIEAGYEGDLQGPIDATVQNWEDDTDFHPFLSSGVDSVRRFSPPGPERSGRHSLLTLQGGGQRLNLGGGIVGEPTLLTVDGRTMARDTDFTLVPEQAEYEGKPFTIVRFARPLYCQPRGISITAKWGHSIELPANVYEAILQGAAAHFFYALPNVADLQSVVRDGLSESFEIASTVTANQRGEAFQKTYADTVKLYRRGA